MLKRFTRADIASVFLRLGLAAIFFYHGALKIAVGSAAWNPDLPAAVQAVIAWGEVACAVACLAGLFTRVAAAGIIAIMVGAMILVTWPRDFAEIEGGLPAGQARAADVGYHRVYAGYEFNVAIIAMAAAVMSLGGGAYSLDRAIRGLRRRIASGAPPAAPPEEEPITWQPFYEEAGTPGTHAPV